MFYERLIEFRKELGLNKRQMSNKLCMNESYYNAVEKGKRKPSRTVLESIVTFSNKPEEYWVYGIKDKKKEIEFSKTIEIFDKLIELNIDTDGLFKDVKKGTIDELLSAALKRDLEEYKNRKKEK